jgi:hypothetical protein
VSDSGSDTRRRGRTGLRVVTSAKEVRQDYRAMFDMPFYRSQIPDDAQPRRPLAHFTVVGWRRGLSPHLLFDPLWYYRDSNAHGNALRDYAVRGADNHRSPSPFFDNAWYRSQLRDRGIPVEGPLFTHYLQAGFTLGLSPHPYVDAAWYWDAYPDVREAGVEPISHLMTLGWSEGRLFSGWLDPEYLATTYGPERTPRDLVRDVFAHLVPARRPTRPGQAPLLDIIDGRRLMARGGRASAGQPSE